ncbi:MAG TPA: hypothetical protein VF911_10775 [Thermoanaerobaculia bacterium]
MSHHYRVYGLHVRSELAIDGLAPCEPPSAVDCEVHRGTVEPLANALDVSWLDEEGEPGARATREGDAVVLEYRDGTRFRVEPHSIVTSWLTTPEDMATYLLGPVLALVLRMRGALVLHASAVVLDGKAIVFTGAAGAGKSTTAAAFVKRGAAMLTDDVAAIPWQDGQPHIASGYARIRLWDDSAAALFGAAEALPRLTPTWEKRYLDASASFVDDLVPLHAIVVLEARDASTRVRRLHGHEAAMAVLARTSVPAFIDASRRADELAQVAELVSSVPVYAVTPRRELGATAELVDVIAEALA